MTTEHIKENVLTDDVLHIADDNERFKGGYQAILEYYTFANAWSDKKHYKRFKTLENAYKFIEKGYK